jgi:hypothetical protein
MATKKPVVARFNISYEGYNPVLDDAIESALAKLGGRWTDSGYCFGIRDISFDFTTRYKNTTIEKALGRINVAIAVKVFGVTQIGV